MASGGLLRASPGQRLRRLGQELLPHRSGTQMGACGHRCGVDAQLQAANSRPARRAIAIATALDNYRGGHRGFLPRGLCNTCPTALRVLDRLCGWAGVTQALTIAVGRDRDLGSRCQARSRHRHRRQRGDVNDWYRAGSRHPVWQAAGTRSNGGRMSDARTAGLNPKQV